LAAVVTFLCVWRAITAELAAKIGIRQGYLSDLGNKAPEGARFDDGEAGGGA
jgi:hypothetical protein